jgi:hypothetical protein
MAVWDGLDEASWSGLKHNYGMAADVPPLLRLCASADVTAAARALDDLDNLIFHQGGWVCPAATAALPFLVRLAGNPQVTVRAAVIDLIATIASEATRVRSELVDPGWRAALDTAARDLLALLDDAVPEVRRAAVYLAGVGGLAAGVAVPALQARLRDEPDQMIRCDIVVSLGAAASGTPLAAEVSAELARLAQDGGGIQLQLAAVHGLARAGGAVTGAADLMVRAAVHQSAAGWQDSAWFGGRPAGIIAETGRLLLEDPRAAAAFAAGVASTGDALQRIAALGHAGALLHRWRTVPGPVLPFLAGQLEALEPDARYRAAYLLAGLGREARPYADQLASLAEDDAAAGRRGKVTVGDAAVWALARLADARCLPGVRARLLGGRPGFATRNIHYRPGIVPLFDLPGIGPVVTAADPAAVLLDPVISRLRRATRDADPILAAMLCECLGRWGPRAEPAVPELRRLLARDPVPYPAVAKALGQIGERARTAAQELRNHAQAGSLDAAWALWRVSGQTQPTLQQLTTAALTGARPLDAVRYLADFGPLAAPAEGRLRDLLGSHDDWVRTEAAHTLWRITGDPGTAVTTLTNVIEPLADGGFLPARLAAMTHLAVIAQPAPDVTAIAQAVLSNPRRLAYFGGWRTFTEDDQIRAAAAEYLHNTTPPEPR